jgi:hypothetical protein
MLALVKNFRILQYLLHSRSSIFLQIAVTVLTG